jgi:hypothetical protein
VLWWKGHLVWGLRFRHLVWGIGFRCPPRAPPRLPHTSTGTAQTAPDCPPLCLRLFFLPLTRTQAHKHTSTSKHTHIHTHTPRESLDSGAVALDGEAGRVRALFPNVDVIRSFAQKGQTYTDTLATDLIFSLSLALAHLLPYSHCGCTEGICAQSRTRTRTHSHTHARKHTHTHTTHLLPDVEHIIVAARGKLRRLRRPLEPAYLLNSRVQGLEFRV